jgi:pyruvate ferredoxin oxidoreductase alpha subunit
MKAAQVIMETGNNAAALAVKSARVDVVPGYPITPQTSIMEAIAAMVEKGELHARFIPVEGEHSAMAAAVAAAAAGARVFTATSANGLLYMHEVLHMASGGRLPVVMVNVNRGVFAPWTLWSDHQDSFAQRDTGWIQYHCSSNQEVFNAILQAFRVAEQINIPVMVNYDGFAISHCLMPLTLPPQEDIDRFLPPHEPEWRLDPDHPSSFSNVFKAPDAIERLGVGKNMVRSIRFWCQAFKIIEIDRTGFAQSTRFGDELLCPKGWDPFLEDILSGSGY